MKSLSEINNLKYLAYGHCHNYFIEERGNTIFLSCPSSWVQFDHTCHGEIKYDQKIAIGFNVFHLSDDISHDTITIPGHWFIGACPACLYKVHAVQIDCWGSILRNYRTILINTRIRLSLLQTRKKTPEDVFKLWFGGAGGSWTRVRKPFIFGTTCLVDL